MGTQHANGGPLDVLRYVNVFVRVAELQSFSEAGRQLGLAKSAVSKQINSLEEKLGTQLITRSTRKLVLTDAGKNYYQYCRKIIDLGIAAENELRDYQDQPRGVIRIAGDLTFGRLYLVPLISRIHDQYPELKIELLLEDRIVNIIEENIDLSIRVGWLQDSNFIARKLFDSPFVVFSSPGYIEKNGFPDQPKCLAKHQWVGLSLLPAPLTWQFSQLKGVDETVYVNPSITTNSVDALVTLVKNGSGISALAEHVIRDELDCGELVPVLEQYRLQNVGVYVIYPKKKATPLKTQVVLNALIEAYGQRP